MLNDLNPQNLTLIYESKRSRVYRSNKDGKPVILKLMALNAPSIHELAQLKQEHDILAKLDHKGIIKSYGISTLAQHTTLVLEDFGAASLAQVLAEKTLALDVVLTISIKICEALVVLHQHNIIHKDINPSNIVWNQASGEVKIIDFNMSTTLSREVVEFKSLNVLEGTLPYIAPEQTGRMNRAVDYRSDLYSFGATLYHLLTNKLPFEADSEIGFVHAHIAKEPVPPHQINSDLPVILSEIVLKLLAKNAEDRYQSALGLQKDLERCLRQWQENNSIINFAIAENDVPNKLRLPQKLYGREKEVQKLLSSFERVQTGQAEILLITGHAGVGKTSLVQEVHKPITASKGYFIAGKFEQLQRDIPYRALMQAFESFTKQLLGEPAEKLAVWKEKLLTALGINAGVITEVIPSLEDIIGKQSASKLPSEQTKNRFNLVFQNFIRALAQPEHPLTIFLDDLQWADESSLRVIEQVYIRTDDKSLLLIGAYRDNEVSAPHLLRHILHQLENDASISYINLGPLQTEHLEEMLIETLYAKPEKVQALTQLVQQKTLGNPYFVSEFLKELYRKQALYFTDGSWQWNVQQIELQGYTDNIVTLMESQIEGLPSNTKELLTIAACIGSTFYIAILSAVAQQDQEEVLANLKMALEQDLLLRHKELYTFAHDRVQKAAYDLIPNKQKPVIHLEIGKILLARTSKEDLEGNIFSIVDQMNSGLDLLTSESERDSLAELNLLAGKRAKASAAYQPALTYFQTALQLLGNNAWSRQYKLSLSLHEETAEVAVINENYALADSLFTTTISNAKSPLDKVGVYQTQILQAEMRGQLEYNLANAQEILKQLGVNLPAKINVLHILKAMLKIRLLFLGENLPKLTLAEENNPRMKAIVSILSVPPSTMSKSDIFVIIVQKQIALQLKHGSYSAMPYMLAAMIMIINFKRVNRGYQLAELALDLNSRCKHDKHHYFVYHVFYGLICPWQAHIQKAIVGLHQNYSYARQDGSFNVAMASLFLSHLYSFFSGNNLSKLEQDFESENIIFFKSNLNLFSQWVSAVMINIIWQAILNLLHDPGNITVLAGKVFDEAQLLKKSSYYATATASVIKLMLAGIFHKYDEALTFANDFEQVSKYIPSTVTIATANFYASLARLAVYHETKDPKLLAKVTKNQRKMKFWAKHAPMNYLHKWHLVEAEKCKVLGKDNQAWQHYQEAVKGAREHKFVNEEALALELTARFFLEKGDERLAGYYLHESYGAYTRWGAIAKLRQLEKTYPQLLIEPTNLHTSTVTTVTSHFTSTKTEHSQLDIASLMQASQTISGELRLDILLARLMETLLENAGATQGHLLLPQRKSEDWLVVASCKVDREVSLQEIPLKDAKGLLPLSLIRFVIRSQKQVILAEASKSDYHQDDYIISAKPKSVLALPLMHQGKLVGLVYLENNLAANVFSENRVEVLTLLSAQAAISLQNALLLSELQDKVTQLELSRKRLVQADEEQRRDIAERLHSDVQSKLVAARLELKNSIKTNSDLPEQVGQDMNRVEGMLEQIQNQDVSQVSYLLHPTVVKVGLIPAVEPLLDEMNSHCKVDWHFDKAVLALDNPTNNKIPEELRLTVYRIIEEALLNIKKHAEATLVKVSVTYDDENLCLEVTDNGRGFEEEEIQPHLGLYSIADRVSLGRGSWKVRSKPSQGTSLRAKLPLNT